jgi:hypothetical protein
MNGFDAKELGYTGPEVSANDAIEQANYWYSRIYREDTNAGFEIPVVDIPAELGADAIYSVEAGDKCIRDANRRNYSLSDRARANYDKIFRRK